MLQLFLDMLQCLLTDTDTSGTTAPSTPPDSLGDMSTLARALRLLRTQLHDLGIYCVIIEGTTTTMLLPISLLGARHVYLKQNFRLHGMS